ncbi:intermembrane space aaa protease iap-1 [Niveomyces insectorum RCEF 264]|uniref:Intermembrane space aaa protease iap-1 n=1 Tax=Niveomyces insectorum RCEF 264 TaxID=1081102 RepID=A0A167NQP6_9HYPO|nr:intermembrane space aaa protease iap-1 [Niveomyces insectorum RCEF 264]
MALQAAGLPNLAAATTDLWPSFSSALLTPWRFTFPTPSSSSRSRTNSRNPAPVEAPSAEPRTIKATPSAVPLPDFLQDAKVDVSLLPRDAASSSLSTTDIRSILANMPPSAIAAASSFLRTAHTGAALACASRSQSSPISSAALGRLFRPAAGRQQQLRYYSGSLVVPTATGTRSGATLFASRLGGRLPSTTGATTAQLGFRSSQQCRTIMTAGGISRNLLENREAAANRNPSSATAQNAFYQVLLKANMPMIVIERYNSGRFAANEATTESYHRALGMISATPGAAAAAAASAAAASSAGGDGNNFGGNDTASRAARLQAVSQAIAAQHRGGSIAVSKGAQGTGAKDAPIHVVVDQPIGDVLFRWVKFVLWFCLFTYFSLVVITMLIEGLNTFKRPTGRADNEVKAENQKTRFSDVHGCDEAKEELQELVEFLKNPAGFSTLGGKLPKGILLVGPPGTGKTLLARAVAGEAGVPFFYMSGSEFDEVYVGVGAKRVRDLFASARSKSPAIVFIDELDAIGSRRNSRDAAYVKQTLNQLLTELDGFEQNSGVIILAATNFPELLDKALTRPGRFDRLVQVDLPDVRGRLAILKHHAHKIKAATNVDLQAIALQTSGLSGAELESIVNQAAIHASKAKSKAVTKIDFDWAKDKVIMGAERKSMVISPKEKELTAYHEAGHALVSYFSPSAPNKLYKVTVLPRGSSLGHTSMLPEMDKYSYSVKDFLAMIDVSLGGKLAEEIVYGNEMVTGGASSDLEHATSIVYRMVTQLGMSEKIGPVQFWNRYNQLSSETKAVIESEVQKTLTEAYARTRTLLQSKRKELDLLAQALLRYETLDKDEVLKVISGQTLPDRIPVPEGPMLVPKTRGPLEDEVPAGLPGPGDEGEDSSAPPPAPPPQPEVP